MARSSFASSAVTPVSPVPSSHTTERFDILQASMGSSSQTRLQQRKRRFSVYDSEAFVSTAIAPNKWIAAATVCEVRLYDTECQDLSKEVKPTLKVHVKAMSKGEIVRAVAISNDLLAIVTQLRLVVYEYREAGNIESNILSDMRIDQKASWTPRSVSILQVESKDAEQSAAAWIAVGGEGVNGVKLYQYSQKPCWTALRNCRSTLTLSCPRNTGLVQSVGFSTFVRMNRFVVYAVTSENRVVCWYIHSQGFDSPISMAIPVCDANATPNPSPHRGEITAVSIFESPSEKPYMLVAVNQKHGSRLVRSFIAPLGTPMSQWRWLSGSIAGRQSLSAAVAPNGRFLVLAEEGRLKLLTLRGAFEGGLTCLEHTVGWSSSLKETAKDVCAISLSVKERCGGIEITGVDGRGHVVSARASVPGMAATEAPSLSSRGYEMAELHGEGKAVMMAELSGEEMNRGGGNEWERLSGEIETMLGR